MLPKCRVGSLLLIGMLVFINGCEKKPDNAWPDKPGKKVLTSFPPIHCFVINVTGDAAVVKPLLTTKGPHGHGEKTPLELKLATSCDAMFINGLTIDDSIGSQIKKATTNTNFNLVVLGDRLDKNKLLEGACQHDHKNEGHADHDHGYDPHVWLSASLARSMVASIRDEMKRIDPANAAGYDERAGKYIAKLEQLEQDGRALLKDKTERKIIAFHDSLQYFGQCYGIKVEGFIQKEPGTEPSRGELDELIKMCKEKKIRVIAVEPQYPRNTSAQTILSELKAAGIDASFVEIDPLETADESELSPDLYERKMRSNLENLAKVLR
ncbi:MAG: metal ABC transporter substrate-binding protein [Planctomycetes bacterium]|nr:metal ABC transporter substrate-binding protein [Planctomycetota bacterium]